MGVEINQYDVWLVNLDPTIGCEIKKKRPCLIISPDEMNRNIKTVIITPMTTKSRNYPIIFNCNFGENPLQKWGISFAFSGKNGLQNTV